VGGGVFEGFPNRRMARPGGVLVIKSGGNLTPAIGAKKKKLATERKGDKGKVIMLIKVTSRGLESSEKKRHRKCCSICQE